MSKFLEFMKDESGASAGEYALILAIIGAGIVTAAGVLRTSIEGAMTRTATVIDNGVNP